MNKSIASLKTWCLTHHLALWGETALAAIFLGLASWILWERA